MRYMAIHVSSFTMHMSWDLHVYVYEDDMKNLLLMYTQIQQPGTSSIYTNW